MLAPIVMSVALAALLATLAGGLFALKLGARLPVILGFSAGAVVGVALFDLLPEALANRTGNDGSVRGILAIAALGFFLYALIDRAMALHDHAGTANPRRGWIGAASFSAHSLLDGLALGFAFQAGQGVGLVVAAGVLAHDFSDGINTVNLVVRNGGSRRGALKWLWADAVAPVMGAGLSLFITLPKGALGPVLAVFAGFFFYIGVGDLLPQAARIRPRLLTAMATLLGAGVILLATRLAS